MPSLHDGSDGACVGLVVGESLGAGDGLDVGLVDGAFVVGANVGASVLSQQPRNVPPCVGQHCPPASPSAKHRGCSAQLPEVVGECDGAGVGDREGRGVGEDVGEVDGHTLGDGDGSAVGAAVLSQQLKKIVPPNAGQHIDPGIVKPKARQRAWAVQSAPEVGLIVGVALGEADGTALGELVGESDGTAVGRDVAHTAVLSHKMP